MYEPKTFTVAPLLTSFCTMATNRNALFASLLSLLSFVVLGEVSASAAVPAAPANPAAAAPIETQVELSWTASSGATSYNIYRGTSPSNETQVKSGITTTTYEDTGLNNGQTYYYGITAVNNSGESSKSNVSVITVPEGPTGVTATPGDSQVSLTWNASTGATSYQVYRDTLGGAGGAARFPVTGTSFTDTGLVNGTLYYYEIGAINSSGQNYSNVSPTSPVTPVAATSSEPPATPPSSVTATAGNANVVLSWKPVSNATSYQILRGLTSTTVTTFVGTSTTLSYTDSGITNGIPYYYIVKAASGGGQTSSTVVTATPYLPSAPGNVSVTAGSGQVVLTWTATNAGYAIYRSTASGAETLLDSGLTGSTFTDVGVINGTTYFYQVQGLNAGGSSPLSAEVSASPTGTAPQSWSGNISFGLPGEPMQTCSAYIPDINRPIMAAFLKTEGSNMQAMATKYNAIVLGIDGFTTFNFGTAANPIFLNTPDDTSHLLNVLDCRWPERSALRLQAALNAAAQSVPTHPEIANTGLVMYGFSEGTDNVNLAVSQPALVNRVLAVINESEIDEDCYNPLATMDTAPHLFLASGLSDDNSTLNKFLTDFPNITTTYDLCARGFSTNQGAPFTVLNNAGVGHGGNVDHPFISIWLDSILSQRLPATVPSSSPVSLPSWQNTPAWVGTYDLSTSTSSPWGSSGNPGIQLINNLVASRSAYTDPRPFTWLPSQNTSQSWLTYSATGIMSSFTPAIISSTTVTATSDSAFNYQITATNEPTSFNATGPNGGALPAGLSINTANGLISGTPTVAGTYQITLTASNNLGTSTSTITVTIAPAVPSSDTPTMPTWALLLLGLLLLGAALKKGPETI
jgi:fibronectin type 3 domain-containing protein